MKMAGLLNIFSSVYQLWWWRREGCRFPQDQGSLEFFSFDQNLPTPTRSLFKFCTIILHQQRETISSNSFIGFSTFPLPVYLVLWINNWTYILVKYLHLFVIFQISKTHTVTGNKWERTHCSLKYRIICLSFI